MLALKNYNGVPCWLQRLKYETNSFSIMTGFFKTLLSDYSPRLKRWRTFKKERCDDWQVARQALNFLEKCCKKTNFSPFQLVQLLSQFAIRETKLLQVDTQRGDVNITHLTRKLKIEDAYQFLLKHINSEALDSRRVDFMMLTGLALDEDDKLKEDRRTPWSFPYRFNQSVSKRG